MIETSLITETRQYKEAWLKMLPKLGESMPKMSWKKKLVKVS